MESPSTENDCVPLTIDVSAVSSVVRRASRTAICWAMVLLATPLLSIYSFVASIGETYTFAMTWHKKAPARCLPERGLVPPVPILAQPRLSCAGLYRRSNARHYPPRPAKPCLYRPSVPVPSMPIRATPLPPGLANPRHACPVRASTATPVRSGPGQSSPIHAVTALPVRAAPVRSVPRHASTA